jgi:hypothetical protein
MPFRSLEAARRPEEASVIRIPHSMARFARRALPGFLAMAAAVAALADSVGGRAIPVEGSGRLSLRGSGLRPLQFHPRVQLEFDGASGDEAGTGTLLAYDEFGINLEAEIPLTWTATGASSFTVNLDHGTLADYLGDLLSDAVDRPCSTSVDTAACRGVLRRNGTKPTMNLGAAGFGEVDGGGALRMKLKMKMR